MVKKLEDILVGHGVTQSTGVWFNDGRTDLSWDAKRKHICVHGSRLVSMLESDCSPLHAELVEQVTALVTKAIESQRLYEERAQDAATDIAKYIANVGWYKPELVNPVEPVLPAGVNSDAS